MEKKEMPFKKAIKLRKPLPIIQHFTLSTYNGHIKLPPITQPVVIDGSVETR